MSELKYKTKLQAPIEKVWYTWTDSESITKWFCPHANIDPKLGGAYELFFDPNNHEHQCTKGCKITRFEPLKLLEFSWRGPDVLHNVMDPDSPQTHVQVTFNESGDETEVIIIHGGWGQGIEWKKAIDWHDMAWQQVINSLEKYFNG